MARTITTQLFELAASQHGVVNTHSGRSIASVHQLRREFSSPRWRRESRSVFGAAGAPRTPLYKAMVQLLRAGPGAVVSHFSALWLWGVLPERLEPFDVTNMRAANGSKRKADGIFVHETRKMPGSHVTTHLAFPIVTPSRALADVAATTAMGRVERWLDRAWMMRLVDYGSLHSVLGDLNVRGRRGVRPLSALVERRGPDYVPPESGLESRLNRVLGEASLPAVRRQIEVGGERWLGRVDFRLGDTPVIVEVQSDTYHWSLSSEEDDRRRSDAMEAAGFSVVPIWESAVWHDPSAVVGAVEAALRELHR